MPHVSIAIDSEFQSLIPPLSDDEYERLEKSILIEGVRDPIITWNGTIIDGHNRYNICDEHGIPFKTVEREFASRDAAKLFIISNQLSRRNLPVAAIGLLKLEEKDIVARQAKEQQGKRTDLTQANIPPNLGECSKKDKHDGETMEQLAADIPIGRESLRKLDVIKQKAEEGDPVAIEERAALNSGEKKSIHGSYVRVVGKQRARRQDKETAEDGRKICSMCGEPIDEGDESPFWSGAHIVCVQEYQRQREHELRNSRKQRESKFTEDGRRICTVCGKPIDEGDAYPYHPSMHKRCKVKRSHEYNAHSQYGDPDKALRENVHIYSLETLSAELTAQVVDFKEAIEESIKINDSMGVHITASSRKQLDRAISRVFTAINNIKEQQ